MRSELSEHKRQWRDYQTESGARPIKDFLLALPDEDRAAVLEEMEYVREHGTSVARHLRHDIYEVRTIYNTKAYRILFACQEPPSQAKMCTCWRIARQTHALS